MAGPSAPPPGASPRPFSYPTPALPYGSPAGSGPPSYAGTSSASGRERALSAVASVRDAMATYRWVLVLSFMAGLIAAATLPGSTSAGGGLLNLGNSLPTTGPNNTTVYPHPAGSGLSTVGAGVAALFGLIGLVLIYLSYRSWKKAVDELEGVAAGVSPAARERAASAGDDLYTTRNVFIIEFIVTIIAGVVFFLALAASIMPVVGQNGQVSIPASSIAGIRSTLIGGVVGLLLLSTAFNLLLYYFATRSHAATLSLAGPSSPGPRFARARVIIFLGVLLAPLGLVGLFVPDLSFVGIFGPLLILVGFHEMIGVFDDFAGSALPGTSIPAAPGA